MTSKSDDAESYKHAMATEWNRAADGWHAWTPFVREWLRIPTRAMLDRAGIGGGARVLDVAAGDGDQAFDALERTGPSGSVVAVDAAQDLLSIAVATARSRGIANLHARVMDAESLDFERGSFDAAISRLGIMYCPSPVRALAEIRRVLRPGSSVAILVFGEAARNPFFSIPVSVIRRRVAPGAASAGGAGPFSLGAPGLLAQSLAEAGFADVCVETLSAPARMQSVDDCIRFRVEASGTIKAMMAPLDERARAEAWEEMRELLRAYETATGFESPCEVLLGSGVA